MDNRGRTSTTLGHDSSERSLEDILTDIAGNTQDIIRSEINLAKIEIAETARRVRSSSMALASGGVFAIYALGFFLLAAMFALEIVLPSWLAALIIGVLVLIAAAIGLSKGRQIVKALRPPKRTMQTLKEDFEWMKEQAKS